MQDNTTNLTKFGLRYQNPNLGRWTQLDPTNQDDLAYGYVSNNPINYTDPTGANIFEDIAEFAGGLRTCGLGGGASAFVAGAAASAVGVTGGAAAPVVLVAATYGCGGSVVLSEVTGGFVFSK